MFKHCVVVSILHSYIDISSYSVYTSLYFRKPRNIKIRSLHYEMCIFMFIYILNLSWFFIVFFCMIFMYIIYTTRIFPGFIFLLVKVWFPIYFDCIFQISYFTGLHDFQYISKQDLSWFLFFLGLNNFQYIYIFRFLMEEVSLRARSTLGIYSFIH